MTPLEQRKSIVLAIQEARHSGARLEKCCELVGLSSRTFQRWVDSKDGTIKEDGRPGAQRPEPTNKLSKEEHQEVLDICHQPEFASLPPGQIVPRLADKGVYVASESTFYRILRESGEQHYRGRARAPKSRGEAAKHVAFGACEVWSWDISWLPGPVKGLFYYLYMIVDIYSRKIVGWEVHERESSELGAEVMKKAVLGEGCVTKLQVLHSDNGSPQKGFHMVGLLEHLGVMRSHSRPRISNDNAFSESLFKTCKYRPEYPNRGFKSLDAARVWMSEFVFWYNEVHKHSGLGYVSPNERHTGRSKEILDGRKKVYEEARSKNPERWSGKCRSWEEPDEVFLNKGRQVKEKKVPSPSASSSHAPSEVRGCDDGGRDCPESRSGFGACS